MLRLISLLFMSLMMVGPVSAQGPVAALILQHETGVVTAAWNGAETQILTATEGGLAQVWSVESGELLLTIDHNDSPLTHAYWLDEGAAILSADESGLILLSSQADGEARQQWLLDGMPIALEVNGAGTQALAFTDVAGGAILSLGDGARVAEFDAADEISGASLSADETRVRAWSEDGTVYSWHLASGEAFEVSPPHRGMLLGLLWNADDTRVLAWFTDGLVNLYESDGVSIGRGRISGARHNSFVQQAILSADESQVMSWAGDDTVHVWSADNGRSQLVFRHEDWVIGARWDPAEARVISWSHIYVYLWESDGSPRRFRHRNLVRGAIWNSDATQILSWSWDGTARVWDA